MQMVTIALETLRRVCEKAGPYLLLEIFLPGGTLLALLLFLYRRRKLGRTGDRPYFSAEARAAGGAW
jgi:hypothetical protein